MIGKFLQIVREYFSSQKLVVKILRSRQLRDASLKTTLHCISSNIVSGAVPAIREQKLAVTQTFLSKTL